MNSKIAAGILISGNEVLFGKTRDTNGPFVAAHLRRSGVSVQRSLVVADEVFQLKRALSYLAEDCDLVIITGGLGPTVDDLTAEVVAQWFGVPLSFQELAWQTCVQAFARLGKTDVPETNKKQAMLPLGCRLIPNPVGTALGFELEASVHGKSVRVVCLPGVPSEMEPMFLASVLPTLNTEEIQVVSRSWQVFGLGESAMQQRVLELEKQVCSLFPEAVISYQAHLGYVTYSYFAKFDSAQMAQEWENNWNVRLEKEVQARFAHHIVAQNDQPLAQTVLSALQRHSLKLSLAESCTGGELSKECVAIPGASRAFLGSIVCYDNQVKEMLLNVPKDTLQEKGAVSEQTVRDLSEGALRVFQSDLALSISGVAGPEGGTERHPVGLVWFGLALGAGISEQQRGQILEKLRLFGWQAEVAREPIPGSLSKGLVLTCRQNFGSRSARHIIQKRAVNFALGSLAALSSALQ
jgi:nicotinamide-nucleotide amidase